MAMEMCMAAWVVAAFLTPYISKTGKSQYYGRFNQGVVTLNLVDIALSSGGDIDSFWTIFDERSELCHKALKLRHERLEGTLSDVAPVLYQDGAFARLKEKRLTNFCMTGIQQFHLDMQVYMNA